MNPAATATIAPDQIPTPISRLLLLELEILTSVVLLLISMLLLPSSRPAASRPATANPNNNIKKPRILAVTYGHFDLQMASIAASA